MTDNPPTLDEDFEAFYEREFDHLMCLAIADGVSECDAERVVHDVLLASIPRLAAVPNLQQHLEGALLAAVRHQGTRR